MILRGLAVSGKVLLVDDDERLRNLVEEYLEGYGYRVISLPDGSSVLRSIEEESPDIVILDVMLPVKDGLEVLREIRTAHSVPVIMLTAKGEDADRIVGLEMGADDYLPKPFNPRELLARMKAVIRRVPHPEKRPGESHVDPAPAMERRLRAILSADAKDYTRLMADDEMATIETLKTYRESMRTHIETHLGRVVDSPGDNLLAEFGSVVNAVQCATKIQEDLKARNNALPRGRRMEFRIGINLGDVIMEGDRVYGDGVNIAARIEALAEAGGICISGTVFDQIEDKLAFPYVYLGERQVKNVRRPIRIYRIGEERTPPVNKG
ncbi:MAG: response regulator [Deltaproteobacteria bacterium]|nr:response regulator [Deltaproteobacteria bacterium]